MDLGLIQCITNYMSPHINLLKLSKIFSKEYEQKLKFFADGATFHGKIYKNPFSVKFSIKFI
jgi:hypothetical protein